MGKLLALFASGRGSNGEAIYKAIQEGHINGQIALIITDKADAGIVDKAQSWQIPCVHINPKDFPSKEAYEEEILKELGSYKVEGIILAGYMRLLGTTLIRAYEHNILNIHPALLPSFTGLHAQKQALEGGVKFSGCTVHFVDAGMDTGPIIAQAVVPVLPDDTEHSLSERILREEHRIYPEVVRLFCDDALQINGKRVTILEQKA